MKVSETLLTMVCVFGIAVGQILFKLAALALSGGGLSGFAGLIPI